MRRLGQNLMLTALVMMTTLTFAFAKRATCSDCRELVDSIMRRLDETASGGHGGGNSQWEERALRDFSRSEVRLVEMLDDVCGKKEACNELVAQHEEVIEKWFFGDGEAETVTHSREQLERALCASAAKVCCPAGTWGEKCQDCPGRRNEDGAVCSGHGKCKSDGDRTATHAKCQCDTGYAGSGCQKCKKGFFRNRDSGACERCFWKCARCSRSGNDGGCKSCSSGHYLRTSDSVCVACGTGCKECTGPEAGECTACMAGYYRNAETNMCDVCVCNGRSSNCDAVTGVCSGCSGHSTGDHCDQCVAGYEMVDNECQDIDDCLSSPCRPDAEMCENAEGFHVCTCATGYVRNERSECVPAEPTKDEL